MRTDPGVVVEHLALGRLGAGYRILSRLETARRRPSTSTVTRRGSSGITHRHAGRVVDVTRGEIRTQTSVCRLAQPSLPLVTPSDCTSQTSTGCIQVAPRASTAGTGVANGDSSAVKRLAGRATGPVPAFPASRCPPGPDSAGHRLSGTPTSTEPSRSVRAGDSGRQPPMTTAIERRCGSLSQSSLRMPGR